MNENDLALSKCGQSIQNAEIFVSFVFKILLISSFFDQTCLYWLICFCCCIVDVYLSPSLSLSPVHLFLIYLLTYLFVNLFIYHYNNYFLLLLLLFNLSTFGCLAPWNVSLSYHIFKMITNLSFFFSLSLSLTNLSLSLSLSLTNLSLSLSILLHDQQMFHSSDCITLVWCPSVVVGGLIL